MTIKEKIQLQEWWLAELQTLTAKVIKQEEKREERLKRKHENELADYASLDEIQEAYGVGTISLRKYEHLCDLWENTHNTVNPMYDAQLELLQDLYQETKNALISLKREVE